MGLSLSIQQHFRWSLFFQQEEQGVLIFQYLLNHCPWIIYQNVSCINLPLKLYVKQFSSHIITFIYTGNKFSNLFSWPLKFKTIIGALNVVSCSKIHQNTSFTDHFAFFCCVIIPLLLFHSEAQVISPTNVIMRILLRMFPSAA